MNAALMSMPVIVAAHAVARQMKEEEDELEDMCNDDVGSLCTDSDNVPIYACVISTAISVIMLAASSMTAYDLVHAGASWWSWLGVGPSLAFCVVSYWLWEAYFEK